MSPSAVILPTPEELQRRLCEVSLSEFIKSAWHTIEPNTDYLQHWHIDYMCEYLEAVTAGEITRLIINIPPRYMKSIAVSVMWPCWEWGPAGNPHLRYLFTSYGSTLSTLHSISRRRVLESEWYRQNWLQVQMSEDQNTKLEFENTRRGFMVATSMGGTSTGRGGDRVVIDDPLNPQEAASDTLLASANETYDSVFSTRLDDKKKGAIVIVMQRLHERDVTGHILAREPGVWTNVVVPALSEGVTRISFPKSGREIVRDDDEVLWPERESRAQVEVMRRTLGSYGFSAQYQQRPSPKGGGMLKDEWWKYYRPDELPDDFDAVIQSWDTTFKGASTSDYCVGQVWGRRGADCYLLDQVRGRWSFLQACAQMENLSRRWPRARLKLVEDSANGPAIVDMLKRKVQGIVLTNAHTSKEARVSAVSPVIESGNVFIPDPEDCEWIDGFRDEMAHFPKGVHDDMVDAMSQALLRFTLKTYTASSILSTGEGAPLDDEGDIE